MPSHHSKYKGIRQWPTLVVAKSTNRNTTRHDTTGGQYLMSQDSLVGNLWNHPHTPSKEGRHTAAKRTPLLDGHKNSQGLFNHPQYVARSDEIDFFL